ncbi:aminoglycoside phosphotransferase family protein [Thiohalobacter sp.]|uniref:aminoglycoside phosphotransferase family protein n=1 Tax=Thiohalobacter sp. TaxID=2025948 RepID=UPI002601A389|nr:phosphotransferase [Thiohalobacter sp.]
MTDERLAALARWAQAQLDIASLDVAPASADASFRRYFRARDGGRSWILMDSPPEREPLTAFLDVARRLGAIGVHVPEVIAADPERGFALLSDLGSRPYLDALDDASADRLYGDAMAALRVIQARGPGPGELPPYDEALLRGELALFSDWLLARKLGIDTDGATGELLASAFDRLVANGLEQPQVCVHRDYHSRNLMVVEHNNPGILDFQDAVIGPVTYDLVSLLRDCYIRWPRAQVEAWAVGYFEQALQAGILRDGITDETGFLRWFDLMGIQRHLKAAGIFARLDLRDGKPGYLADIPRTLGYVAEVGARYPELARLAGFVADEVLPKLAELRGR